MEIKILGTGCHKCRTLDKLTHDAVSELDIFADISREEDIVRIMNYGIIQTPGLVINGRVVISGRVPSLKEIKELLIRNQ